MGFTVDTHHHPGAGHAVVEVLGEVDQLTRDRLAGALAGAGRGGTAVVLDLSRVTFFSAAGVHCIEDAAEALTARGRTLHLVCPTGGPAWSVLDLLALLPSWPVHPTLDGAARALVGQHHLDAWEIAETRERVRRWVGLEQRALDELFAST